MDYVPGTIYLLHFDRPYRHARYYLGWASDLNSRLASTPTAPAPGCSRSPRQSASGGSWPAPGQATGTANASSRTRAAGPGCARSASTPPSSEPGRPRCAPPYPRTGPRPARPAT